MKESVKEFAHFTQNLKPKTVLAKITGIKGLAHWDGSFNNNKRKIVRVYKIPCHQIFFVASIKEPPVSGAVFLKYVQCTCVF